MPGGNLTSGMNQGEKKLGEAVVLMQGIPVHSKGAGAAQSGLSLTCRNESSSHFSGGARNSDLHGNILMFRCS